ncbi:MAG: response regulator transcription factor [Yokenella regensburgei]|jgi:DNA-binding NarL/FixJ family response regulator|uniref:DNA-binding NarL/FixJ family response regulator n=1 Tax=Yokenella regensburgei TaxID=158877 RepID=A0AB38FX80_9ENTR|nr:response regulator transcription factor [Yokenella regensburgei]KAF1370815.1 DNA-binding NarL/FixJ family response regulator [Yokenella regensburgei]KFD25182.1 putative regulator [Yokenella regensburgei ATCC 49455]MDQ4429405.1 response regulator transcription factor [Yokenella regensburgei]MDR2216948.1 response regulator transcription factor [Yokenella regensburgei]MDR3105904.1 response regulator transcription factor [Yokenella regensburgei]
MQAGCCKNGMIISKSPIIQLGLHGIINQQLPDYEMAYCRAPDELTLLQLRRTVLVVADLSGDVRQARTICQQYYSMIMQYHDIHWVFMVSRAFYPFAVEFLLCPESTLLSDAEPVEHLVDVIRKGGASERISSSLLCPWQGGHNDSDVEKEMLTYSERQVLRLLAKGWCINQIASLLKKSNKTVSAQKNSAMRRLSLRGNAEMYAWINSEQGMQELNLFSAYGEQNEWKKTPQYDMSPL